MLALLGSCSLIQCLFLPGFIVSRWLYIRGTLRTITTSFALSLIINAFLVTALVLLHAYSRWPLVILFLAECFLAYGLTSSPNRDVSRGGPPAPELPSETPWNALELIALVLVLALAAEQAGRVFRAMGSIFSGWDDIRSWNRWAMDWYRGTLPHRTAHYPQLLPEAWSLTYAFMGTERIQFFARGMMGLFGLAAVAVVADLARGPDRLTFLASAWLIGIFLRRLNNMTAGLADVPVAFFALAAIAELLRRENGRVDGAGLRPFVGPVLAAGAALTKQAGLYLAALYPVLACLLQGRSGRRLRTLLSSYAIIAALVVPWYAYKHIEIRSGGDASEIRGVTQDVHHGLPMFDRLAHGIAELAKLAGGPGILAAIVALMLLGFLDRRARWVLALLGIPYMLIWGLWFSYDVRNASLGLGPCAIGCGAGLAILAGRLPLKALAVSRPAWLRLRPFNAKSLIPLAGLALVVIAFAIPDSILTARQDRLQRGLGDPAFNRALYAYRAGSGLRGKILASDLFLLAFTPGWDSGFVLTQIEDTAAFAKDAAKPEVQYLVVPSRLEPRTAAILSDWERSGRFIETFRAGDHIFWTRTADSISLVPILPTKSTLAR